MSPTYSIRRGNRYRYYISSALLHDRRPDAGSLARINADDVERLVVAVLGRELSRPGLLADGPSAGWSAETRTLVRDTVERVVIQSGQVQITRRPAATSAAGDPPDEDGDPRQVHVEPLPAPRPRARKEIIVPGGRDSPTTTAKPGPHPRDRPRQVMDARPSRRKICGHEWTSPDNPNSATLMFAGLADAGLLSSPIRRCSPISEHWWSRRRANPNHDHREYPPVAR